MSVLMSHPVLELPAAGNGLTPIRNLWWVSLPRYSPSWAGNINHISLKTHASCSVSVRRTWTGMQFERQVAGTIRHVGGDGPAGTPIPVPRW